MQLSQKSFISIALIVFLLIGGVAGFFACSESISPDEVGLIYDKRIGGTDKAIPGTAISKDFKTGFVFVNPIFQDIKEQPRARVTKTWANGEEGKKGVNEEISLPTQGGYNATADVTATFEIEDRSLLIQKTGWTDFDQTTETKFKQIVRGYLADETGKTSPYVLQENRVKIGNNAKENANEFLLKNYGVAVTELIIDKLSPPEELLGKIKERNDQLNKTEMAELKRKEQETKNKQDEEMKASEAQQKLIARQAEADAKAYEVTAKAEALEIAAQSELNASILYKEAELEKQKAYTADYFRDKELNVQMKAVETVNENLEIMVVDSASGAIDGVVGFNKILRSLND